MEAATVPWVAGLPAKLWDGKSYNHRSELRHQLNIVTAGQLLCAPKPCGQAIFNKRQEEGRVGSCQKTQTAPSGGSAYGRGTAAPYSRRKNNTAPRDRLPAWVINTCRNSTHEHM